MHRLGALPPPPIWTITTPTTSTCEEVNGGVICSLEDGSVALGPQGFTELPPEEEPPSEGPFVILDPGDKAGTKHTGLYGLPEEGLELTVQPQSDWLPFCEGEPKETEARCPESPKDAPGHKDPPELPPDTKTLNWHMTVDKSQETEICQIQVRWEAEAGEQEETSITLDVQPSSLCDSLPATDSGTVEATAVCTWDVLETTTYEEYEEPESVVEPSEVVNMPLKYLCEYYLAWWPGFVYYYGHVCQDNPMWRQPPEDQHFDPIQPGEEDFRPTQLIEIRYSGCQWEEWPEIRSLWVNGHKRYGPVFLFDAEHCRLGCPECINTDACIRQFRGRNTCVAEREYLLWKGVWNCRFAQRPDEIVVTNPVQLLLRPEP